MNNVHVYIEFMNMVQEKNRPPKKNSAPGAAATARHEELHAKLLAVAAGIIAESGLKTLKIRDIAAQAGCSVGAVYNVFTDFEALVLHVNALTLADIDAHMARVPAAPPAETMRALADAYLDFAVAHFQRWSALFTHTMPENQLVPDWFMAIQARSFSHVEAPLRALRPDLAPSEAALLGRSVFAAVHGIVSIGLDGKTGEIALAALREQIAIVVSAIAAGLAAPL